MNNNFNLDDLEDFLSESAENHRMYPSDKVWRNIDQDLHGNKRWPALTFGAFLTGALITAGLILIHPDKNLFEVGHLQSAGNDKSNLKNPAEIDIADAPGNTGARVIEFPKQGHAVVGNKGKTVDAPSFTDASYKTGAPIEETVVVGAIIRNIEQENFDSESSVSGGTSGSETKLANSFTDELVLNSTLTNDEHRSLDPVAEPLLLESTTEASAEQLMQSEDAALKIIEKTSENTAEAANILVKNKKPGWNIQFYGAPSISYRFLNEEKFIDIHNQNGPLAPNVTNGVNRFVSHKPITGFEAGVAFMYNLTPAVRFRTGLQANIRGYKIAAFAVRNEASTIVLNRGYYSDSLIAISNIGNQQGYKHIEVTNRYFEFSVPLALDMRIANWKKLQLYVAAGLQPTYQFNKSMYMVSSDYKNYIQEPNLVRHFNINTSLEAFMSYKAAGVTWQVGPQIRYQVLPGAINDYPVRERLIDYGIKIGVVKTLK